MDDTKQQSAVVLRDAEGRYLSGTCGGPGRPLNSRPKLITALREALDEDETLERLRRVAIERMEAGDPAFWKMLLDRVWPARVELSTETESVVEFRWASPAADDQSQLLISRKGDQ